MEMFDESVYVGLFVSTRLCKGVCILCISFHLMTCVCVYACVYVNEHMYVSVDVCLDVRMYGMDGYFFHVYTCMNLGLC